MPRHQRHDEFTIAQLVKAPLRVIALIDTVLNDGGHIRLRLIVDIINNSQQIFDSIKPLLPNVHPTITRATWDRVAVERWGADNLPAGGVVGSIQAAAVAGRALGSVYQLDLLPLIRQDILRIDNNSGYIRDVRSLLITPEQMLTIRSELVAFRAALTVIAEE